MLLFFVGMRQVGIIVGEDIEIRCKIMKNG